LNIVKFIRLVLNVILSDATYMAGFALNVYWNFTNPTRTTQDRYFAVAVACLAFMYIAGKYRKHVIKFEIKPATDNKPVTSLIQPEIGTKISSELNDEGRLTKLVVYNDIPNFFGFDRK
jgi:hypothetical protein